jgi:hypothetical protein
MTDHSFTLSPFPGTHIPDITIRGRIARTHHLLAVHYSLTGDIGEIRFPEPVHQPNRRVELWLATCFEFFLAIPGQPGYWEFNLSPCGDWNAFRMDAYRRVGFRQEDRVQDVRINSHQVDDCFILDAAIDLSRLFEPEVALQVGITSVIQTRDGNETYWALAHPASQADFHWRENFILLLEAEDHPSSPPSQMGSRPARIHMP